jgi:hypothetical protein
VVSPRFASGVVALRRQGRRLVGVGQLGLGVVLGVLLVGDDGLLGHALAAVEVVEGLEGQRPEARVGLDDAADPAVDQALDGALGPVDGDDLDGFLPAAFRAATAPRAISSLWA